MTLKVAQSLKVSRNVVQIRTMSLNGAPRTQGRAMMLITAQWRSGSLNIA